MKLATVFSGIGGIEQALKRLGVKYDIAFACDNGDVELKLLEGLEFEEYTRLVKLRSKKQLKDPKDIERLNILGEKENRIAESIRTHVLTLSSKKEKKEYIDKIYASHSRQTNFVKKAYTANYNINPDDFHLDIRFLDGSDYKDDNIDLLVGGSPCQSFSSVGAQYGLQDTRGTLFYEFARIVKETQPRVFIYENVRGLTTHDNGRTWEIIQNIFKNNSEMECSIIGQELNHDESLKQKANEYGISIGKLKLIEKIKKNLWNIISAFWALIVALFWFAMRVIWSGISKVLSEAAGRKAPTTFMLDLPLYISIFLFQKCYLTFQFFRHPDIGRQP